MEVRRRGDRILPVGLRRGVLGVFATGAENVNGKSVVELRASNTPDTELVPVAEERPGRAAPMMGVEDN